MPEAPSITSTLLLAAPYSDFANGFLTMGAAAIGVFFVRYWQRSRDRLFLGFAGAFLLLAVNWGLMLFVRGDEARSWLYAIRIVAFGLLALAILDKNRRGGR